MKVDDARKGDAMSGTDLLWAITEERRREADAVARERLASGARTGRTSSLTRLVDWLRGRPRPRRESRLRPAGAAQPR